MHKTLVGLTAFVVLGCGVLMAAEKTGADAGGQEVQSPKEKQLEKFGAMRGRITARMQELQKLAENWSGTVYGDINALYMKELGTVAKQLQEQNAKAPEMRLQVTIDNLNTRSQKLTEMWQQFAGTEWPALGQRVAEPYQVYLALQQTVVPGITTIDGPWAKANLDLDILITALAAVEKRIGETKAQYNAVIADLNKIQANWNAFTKEQ